MFNAMTEQVRQALEAPAKELNDRLDRIVTAQEETNRLLDLILSAQSLAATVSIKKATSKAAQQ